MRKLSNVMLIATIVLAIIAAAVVYFKMEGYKAKINELQTELVRANNLEPETITVTEKTIEIKYKDRTIIKEITKDGYVRFDLSRYRNSVKKADSLRYEMRTTKRKLSALLVETGDNEKDKEKYIAYISLLESQIKKTNGVTKIFTESTGKKDILYIKHRGFTFKPFAGAGYNGQLEPIIGVRLAYYKKYGLFFGSTRETLGIGLIRRLTDIIPFTRNTSIAIMGGYPYQEGNSKIFVGLIVDL